MKKANKLSIVGIVIFLIVATIIAISSQGNQNNKRATKFDTGASGEIPTLIIEPTNETSNDETNGNTTLILSSDKATVLPKPTATLITEVVETEIVADDSAQAQIGENSVTNINVSSEQQKLVDKAKTMLTDLRKNKNLKPSDVKLVSIESREWPNGALGCPEPGAMYIQMITSGYVIILEADNTQYQFNTDTRQSVKLCLIDNVEASSVLK